MLFSSDLISSVDVPIAGNTVTKTGRTRNKEFRITTYCGIYGVRLTLLRLVLFKSWGAHVVMRLLFSLILQAITAAKDLNTRASGHHTNLQTSRLERCCKLLSSLRAI
jgi:hypothetical protein